MSQRIVVGVFANRPEVERAVQELREAGLEEIGIVAQDKRGWVTVKRVDSGAPIEEGALGGALAGGAVGTIAGLAVAAGFIPGFGPAIAAGILGGILSSVGLGAAAGGLLGALIGLGVSEEEARIYENEFLSGRALVTVKADGRHDEAAAIMHRAGAVSLNSHEPAAA